MTKIGSDGLSIRSFGVSIVGCGVAKHFAVHFEGRLDACFGNVKVLAKPGRQSRRGFIEPKICIFQIQ